MPIFTTASVGSALGREAFVSVYAVPGSAYRFADANSDVLPKLE